MFCTSGIGSGKSNAQEVDGLSLMYNNVMKIDVNAGGPSYLEHQKYDYTTSSKNKIAYILNYIYNFNLEDDGKILYANDVSCYSIKIHMIDSSMKKCGFYSGRFYDVSDKQYAIDSKEYNRFLDFIYALKTEKIVLDDEVTFEPSEWAAEDVGKAINEGLVPKLNQINYTGKITRLEVCQLVDNLLKKQNIAKPKSTKNPFSDTTDESVIYLYNHSIINGKTESEFYPYDYITREEFSKVLSNIYHFMNLEVQSDNNRYEYIDYYKISDWAKNYVSFISGIGILIGDTDKKFRPKDLMTKQETIVSLVRLSKIGKQGEKING